MTDDHDASDDAEKVRSFTSWKLDIINSISIDPRLKDSDVRFAIVLFGFMNSTTGQCNPAEETLAELMNCSNRTVEYCKERLKKAGWLTWRRTQRSSTYMFLDQHVDAMIDRRTSIDDARRERRLATITRNGLRIREGDTRKELQIETRKELRIQTRKELRTNTLIEHRKGTPPDSGIDRGRYIPPNFDLMERMELDA